MRVSERYMRGKFRAGALILPESNVKDTFTLALLQNFPQSYIVTVTSMICSYLIFIPIIKFASVISVYALLKNNLKAARIRAKKAP